MSRLDELLPASFKDVTFFVRSEGLTEAGRKIILHDYPNSDSRYIEDQGQLPPQFRVTAFVADYYDKDGEYHGFLDAAADLETALNDQGKGELSLPTFGIVKVSALPYKKAASQQSVGEISFELEFASGQANSGPAREEPTLETVYINGDEVREAISEAIVKEYKVPTITENVKSAIFDLTQAANILNIITTTVHNSTDIESAIKLINANAPKIVRSADSLQSTFIVGLWQKVSEGLTGIKDSKSVKAMLALTKFGSELTLSLSEVKSAYEQINTTSDDYIIPLWPATTAERIIRNANRLTIINAGRHSALATGYEQASAAEYKTQDEVEETRVGLESANRRLMMSGSDIDPGVRQTMDTLRLSSLSVLDKKSQAAFRLVVTTKPVPVSSLNESYNLYMEELTTTGELATRSREIRNLNPSLPTDRLEGELTVLQS